MKRLSTIIVFAVFCSILNAQIPSFFGLEFGKKYGAEQIISAIEAPAEFHMVDTVKVGDYRMIKYIFTKVPHCGTLFPIASFAVLGDNVFHNALFAFSPANQEEVPIAEGLSNSVLEFLLKQYPLKQEVGRDAWSYENEEDGFAVRFAKESQEGGFPFYSLNYSSMAATRQVIMEEMGFASDEPKRPDLQSSFFGLTLGESYTLSQVKSAVGSKGTFYETRTSPSGAYEESFNDTYFAGRTWGFASFGFSAEKQFTSFSAYSAFDDWGEDNKKAQEIYELYRKKLADKYGQPKSLKDGTIYFDGANDVNCYLSLSKEKSVAGNYRLFVHIVYYLNSASSKSIEMDNDEL